MTTHHRKRVVCECGHEGVLHWSENDQPFSKQWESYRMSGFEASSFEIAGYTTATEAVERMKPKCPKCGAIGKVKHA